MTIKALFAAVTLAASLAASPASAGTVVVDALGNSTSGGVGAFALNVTAGEHFTVTVGANDLWSAGALPRWSNADGLIGNRYATGTDDSGQAAGTLIGTNFGAYSQNGLTAAYGTLVGQIGGGSFFVLGTHFSGTASASGALSLYYFDSNNSDNTQFITAAVSGVPEPGTWAMMLLGFAGVASVGALRRRNSLRGA